MTKGNEPTVLGGHYFVVLGCWEVMSPRRFSIFFFLQILKWLAESHSSPRTNPGHRVATLRRTFIFLYLFPHKFAKCDWLSSNRFTRCHTFHPCSLASPHNAATLALASYSLSNLYPAIKSTTSPSTKGRVSISQSPIPPFALRQAS